jgi:DNA repair protein RadC
MPDPYPQRGRRPQREDSTRHGIASAEIAASYSPGSPLLQLPAAERPRERLIALGASALSSAELIAILLRTGRQGETVTDLARNLLAEYGGLSGLSRAPLSKLRQRAGLGPAKASELLAALELARRLAAEQPDEKPTIKSPEDVRALLQLEMSVLEQEQLRVLLLDTKNRVLAIRVVSAGSVNSSVVRVGEVFREAVRENSTSVIVVHNHPSGDPAPSPEDAEVTRRLVAAGRLLDIELLDHVVLGRDGYVSLRQRKLGFD